MLVNKYTNKRGASEGSLSWNTREFDRPTKIPALHWRTSNQQLLQAIQPCQTDDLELVKLFLAARYDLRCAVRRACQVDST